MGERKASRSTTRRRQRRPKATLLHPSTPLVGTWVFEDNDTTVEFTTKGRGDGMQVAVRYASDGEVCGVEDVHWDGAALWFTVDIRKTRTRVLHKVLPGARGTLHTEMYSESQDTLVRKPQPPSQAKARHFAGVHLHHDSKKP